MEQCSGSLFSLIQSERGLTRTPLRLYVGSLHFNLTESDIKQVFEPFGELEFVDLHRDPMTGRSKDYAFVQCVTNYRVSEKCSSASGFRYKRVEDARMALEQMEGFELAGRTVSSIIVRLPASATWFVSQLRVNTVHEKGTARYTQQDSLDEAGGRFTAPYALICC